MTGGPQFVVPGAEIYAPITTATASWRALHLAALAGCTDGYTPVRISLGLPRFWADAERLPYLRDLAPAGVFGLEGEAFDRAYVDRLDRIGVERIGLALDTIRQESGQPVVVLACFEKAGQPCHRRLFADYWMRKTGQLVPEWRGISKHDLAPYGQTSMSFTVEASL